MSDAVLAIDQLGFQYGEKPVLSDISLSLNSGKYYALLGPNGAGKSTLFSLICQLLRPVSGSLSLMGKNTQKNTRFALKQLGIVFQQPTLDLDLTVSQNLQYHASLQGMSGTITRQRIEEELARFGLADRAKDKVRALNGGHRRRVEIARALLHKPKLLLLDEATVGLDQNTRDAMNTHLRALCDSEGITILSSTHLIDEVKPNDELIVLLNGQVKLQQRCEEAMKSLGVETVQQLYRQMHMSGGQ